MGQDQQHLPGSEPVQEPAAMSGTAAGVTASCDYCSGLPAVVYCRADAARLCLLCDRQVHGANGVSSRHARAPLCATCCAAAAVFRRAARFLCSNCDFEENQNGPQDGVPLHDRSTVEGYTGCPSVVELTAALGVCEAEKPPDDGWWSVWEEPQVLSWEDLIVPTTSCHDFHPLLTPSSPKIQRSPNGKMNEELLRQLGKLAMAESGVQTAAHEEAEQADDQLPSCAVPHYMVGHDNFGAENSHEAAAMVPPASQYGGWNASDSHGPDDLCQVEFAYEQVPVSSAEACLSSFVEISEICPSMSHGSSIENSQQANTALGMPMQGLPKKGGYDIACPDRDSVISRYKEKRKTRRFDKQIRYESRKVRADSRLRIKGRFAKANQI